jgi:hypothetical protein
MAVVQAQAQALALALPSRKEEGMKEVWKGERPAGLRKIGHSLVVVSRDRSSSMALKSGLVVARKQA